MARIRYAGSGASGFSIRSLNVVEFTVLIRYLPLGLLKSLDRDGIPDGVRQVIRGMPLPKFWYDCHDELKGAELELGNRYFSEISRHLYPTNEARQPVYTVSSDLRQNTYNEALRQHDTRPIPAPDSLANSDAYRLSSEDVQWVLETGHMRKVWLIDSFHVGLDCMIMISIADQPARHLMTPSRLIPPQETLCEGYQIL
ncbi:hypothetical protein HIM_10783 [Hirsutella minnesotensis 3608]|uniref:Uncharacterized protein n=1 Tax=Hirsutella minnesotensis 3608 TaxID=1043627 RepID=A0A0F7ZJQ1_9HYPO|nr:hypothetical protein HIM_10783 [Hirsutella minnesotensis 3608]